MNKKISISMTVILIIIGSISGYFLFPKPAFPEPQAEKKAKSETPAQEEADRGDRKISKISNLNFLKKVNIANGARPEVIATDDRIFVVYLDFSSEFSPSFSVRIYDGNMDKEITYKKLVERSVAYGRPTDIRVASDGNYLYAFYEQTDGTVANLFGAKYTLDDKFERVAYAAEPIAVAPAWTKEEVGDEVPNDPIALIGPNSIFVITRIYQKSTSIGAPTVYRIREFDNDLKTKLSQFDIDLSELAGAAGKARQASAYFYNGYFYMIIPTTSKSGFYPVDVVTPSDLLLIKFDKNWKIIETKNLSQSHEDIETFVTGFKVYKGLFFVTYKRGIPFVSPLEIYDMNFNPILSEIVKEGGEGRSALEVTNGRIYVGFSGGRGPPPPGAKHKFQQNQFSEPKKAEIYIYEFDE